MRFREAIDGYLQLVSFASLMLNFEQLMLSSLLPQSPSPWLSAESLKNLTSGVRNVVAQPQQSEQAAAVEKP